MRKKTRYTLIFLGFCLFLILAPILVTRIGGWLYNPSTRKFIKTGLLAVRTDPKNVQIFLDNELKAKKNGDIKFLVPKEYEIAIKKPGFFTWEKRLPVLAGQVTWANPSNDKIYLLQENPPQKILAQNILGFIVSNDTVYSISTSTLNLLDIKTGKRIEGISLPLEPKKIIVSESGKFILIIGQNKIFLFNKKLNTFSDVSSEFSPDSDFKFSPQDLLFALQNQNLYTLSFGKKQSVLNNIYAYGFLNDTIYYIQKNLQNNTLALFVESMPETNGQLLVDNLPNFLNGQIYITANKQIFLLADRDLYFINDQVIKLAGNVVSVTFTAQMPSLIFVHEGEINYYNFAENQTKLLTRSLEEIYKTSLPTIGNYGFAIINNKFSAIELDSRNRQNQFDIYQGKKITQMWTNNDSSIAWLLDNGNLINLKLR